MSVVLSGKIDLPVGEINISSIKYDFVSFIRFEKNLIVFLSNKTKFVETPRRFQV